LNRTEQDVLQLRCMEPSMSNGALRDTVGSSDETRPAEVIGVFAAGVSRAAIASPQRNA
jgi:hypothetical protein